MRRPGKIIAIGGGKGGVGKSIVALSMGAEYASQGNKVVLADLDLGAANLHTYLGIFENTTSIADFILGNVTRIEDVIIETPVKNLSLLSGSRFVPGMANPAHWTKLKIMRHLRSIDTDILIIDLGAGVHYNTLDFFGLSDHGIIVTMPEPGAVMNAYGFLKAALYRRLQGILKKHPLIGNNKDKKTTDTDMAFDEMDKFIKEKAPDMIPIIREIREGFRPMLIINRMSGSQSRILIKNLLSLCKNKLGIELLHIGNIPDLPDIRNYLLNIPGFLSSPYGRPYASAISGIIEMIKRLEFKGRTEITQMSFRKDFDDEEIEEIMSLIDNLEDNLLDGSTREQWKLRLFFKPLEVIRFLVEKGINKPFFYENPYKETT